MAETSTSRVASGVLIAAVAPRGSHPRTGAASARSNASCPDERSDTSEPRHPQAKPFPPPPHGREPQAGANRCEEHPARDPPRRPHATRVTFAPMTTPDDLEAFLTRLDRRFEKVAGETYLVSLGPNQPPAVLRVEAPVAVVRVDIGPAPTNDAKLEARLFRRLLELNARDLVHVAYGLDDGRIILDAALELDTLDIGELESVLANLDLALASHVPELKKISNP